MIESSLDFIYDNYEYQPLFLSGTLKSFKKPLDYKDIALIPRVISSVKSRSHPSAYIKIGRYAKMTTPIIASPMIDVINKKVATLLALNGGLSIIHRFQSINNQEAEFLATLNSVNLESSAFIHNVGAAIGVRENPDRLNRLHDHGCSIFCIDTANGATTIVHDLCKKIAKKYPEVDIILGNVASAECFEEVQNWPNVVGVRVGIAGGSACTTSNATGIKSPMISTIIECAEIKKNDVALIADGGIKEPCDMVKAIAVGADAVMLGGAIANTADSPAQLVKADGRNYKVFSGSASYQVQKSITDNIKYIEGTTRLMPTNMESFISLIDRFNDGLASAMSYFDALSLEQFRKNVTYEIIK